MKGIKAQAIGRKLAGIVVVLAATLMAHGQAVESAWGGVQSLWVGAEYANLKTGFPVGSTVRMGGIGGFANYNWNHQYGVEAHFRMVNLNSWHGESQWDLLAGPRYTFLHSSRVRPFAFLEVGMVHMQYPFSMGAGNSFALVPGGGVEYRLSHKLSVRGSYELQDLVNPYTFSGEPSFSLHPNGFVAGVSWRIR